MHRYFQELKSFFRKGDMVLLLLLLVTTVFGVIVIASTTNYMGSGRYIVIQLVAAALGVMCYAAISAIDMDLFAEHRLALVIFNVFMLLLLIPFGTDNNTGNRSWLELPLVPVDIQPAEICKITYILVMASVMANHQSKLSSIPSVMHMVFHLLLLVGLNMVLSRDLGVSLIFVFIFIGMAFSGGVNLLWFVLAISGITALFPFAMEHIFDEHQKQRIMVLIDPEYDAAGIGARYHSRMSLKSLTGGGMTGQGLFNGNRTQNADDHLFAQHTDYIFSAIGEELGFVGNLVVIVLMLLIIARCIQVGNRSQDYMRRMVCFGAASALMFQVLSNVGMCIGVTPVIGLTLPFMSYGGSSIVSLYAMLGLVSGVHARPASISHERYIRAY